MARFSFPFRHTPKEIEKFKAERVQSITPAEIRDMTPEQLKAFNKAAEGVRLSDEQTAAKKASRRRSDPATWDDLWTEGGTLPRRPQ